MLSADTIHIETRNYVVKDILNEDVYYWQPCG